MLSSFACFHFYCKVFSECKFISLFGITSLQMYFLFLINNNVTFAELQN